jgi:hypothetical protein
MIILFVVPARQATQVSGINSCAFTNSGSVYYQFEFNRCKVDKGNKSILFYSKKESKKERETFKIQNCNFFIIFAR